MAITKKNLLTGLVLLTLLVLVGADLGLVRSEAHQVEGLALWNDAAAPVALRAGSDVSTWRTPSADWSVAADLGGRLVKVGAAGPSASALSLLDAWHHG